MKMSQAQSNHTIWGLIYINQTALRDISICFQDTKPAEQKVHNSS